MTGCYEAFSYEWIYLSIWQVFGSGYFAKTDKIYIIFWMVWWPINLLILLSFLNLESFHFGDTSVKILVSLFHIHGTCTVSQLRTNHISHRINFKSDIQHIPMHKTTKWHGLPNDLQDKPGKSNTEKEILL